MKQELELAIAAIVKELFQIDVEVELSRPEEKFGDFATNIALQIAKQLGSPPRDVAAEIADKLRASLPEVIDEVSIAGPGFINLRMHDALLGAAIGQAPRPKTYSGQKILVEYSDTNPFKPLHAGHLYTTLVGDVIARLVEQGGGQVVRLNYGGDVGMHVGKAMWGIIQHLGGELPEKLSDINPSERPDWLGARYVEGSTAYEDDVAAKTEIVAINKRVYELHANNDHESPFAQIYWTGREWSYEYFKRLYQELKVVQFDRFFPESEVAELGLRTVRQQLVKGVYQESDGAVIYDGESRGLHARVFINSEGLPTYEAKEVGLILTKWRDYSFDKSIIITASEQDQYMQVVMDSIAQFEPEAVSRSSHINHGVLKLQGGVKMSSRKGNVLTALEVIEAARQAGQELENKADSQTVLAAIKYALLKVRIGSDVIYDPKESIALEGNSGPYLQYAHARARSIIAKASGVDARLADNYDPAERSLARKLTEYPEVVDKAVVELLPHVICTYLYELAQQFNSFYEKSRVIDDPRATHRLVLIEAYATTLKNGLELLGITAPDSM